MSNPPRRLKDDPDFRWETGCDLADEAFVVGGYDLPGLRANVLAATQPPSGGAPLRPPSRGPWAATLAGALLLLGLGGTAVVGLSQGADGEGPSESTPRAPVADVSTHVAPVAAPIAAPVVPETTVEGTVVVDGPERQAVPHQPTRPTEAAKPPPTQIPAGGEAEAPIDEVGAVPEAVEVEPSGQADPGPVSTLAAEVAMYDVASDQLAAGDAVAAAEGYRAYLERYPDGRLVTESKLGLLRAQVAMGASDEVEALAVQVLSDPRLAAKRDELLRMRAENLVMLERCDEAIVVARELPSRDAAPIRRACRWKP